MADPGTVAGVAVRPGHNPGDVVVTWTALVADPLVLTYNVFIDDGTGVDSSSAFRATAIVKVTRTRCVFRNKLAWRAVFATVTATNSEGTSASDATEAQGVARTRV